MSAYIDARLAAHRKSKHIELLENVVRLKVASQDALRALEFLAEMHHEFGPETVSRRARNAACALRVALREVA